jgi:hypothetical protein
LDAKQQFIPQSVSLRLPSVAYAKEIYSNLVKRNLLLLPDVESKAATQGTHRASLWDRMLFTIRSCGEQVSQQHSAMATITGMSDVRFPRCLLVFEERLQV